MAFTNVAIFVNLEKLKEQLAKYEAIEQKTEFQQQEIKELESETAKEHERRLKKEHESRRQKRTKRQLENNNTQNQDTNLLYIESPSVNIE
ncbi:6397_t:CDS:2 [Dentiscutata erythropus]|uniref:6397_t:CDS:1 n=1 Tax=Dentiscutata erythropus TaxID=1348616 RepID=A0A9N9IAE6_9GLOM|nr:6397_t:CDS:2 [Dentiscutata erythropus]